jgi:hypothetical protein
MDELIHHPCQYFIHLFIDSDIEFFYRSDIKYHTALNIIVSVVPSMNTTLTSLIFKYIVQFNSQKN